MKERFKLIYVGIIAAVAILLVFVFSSCGNLPEKLGPQLPSETEQIEQKDTLVTPVTINDVLEYRNYIIECNYYDSVFLHMPDIPLIAILMKYGTDMSQTDIAKEYLKNRKYYDDVSFGAQINEIYKQQNDTTEHKIVKKRQIEPDSIPKQPSISSIL